MFNVVRGESLAVCAGDHFAMVLPDGSSLEVEQTADDFSITTPKGELIHTQPTSPSAKAQDQLEIDNLPDEFQQLMDDEMDMDSKIDFFRNMAAYDLYQLVSSGTSLKMYVKWLNGVVEDPTLLKDIEDHSKSQYIMTVENGIEEAMDGRR